jgi:tetratricopeptide (TPR) repeat protein
MIIGLIVCSSNLFSQQEKKDIIEGNKQFENKKYGEAEKSYNRALGKNKNSYKGSFNLGNTYYKEGKYEDAANQFQALTHRAASKDTLSKAYHNLGNSLLRSKKYQESVDAYKNALKNNPNDDDTRYNLSYAQQMLKQKQQQQKKDNKDKKDKKDDKKDKDKKDENKKKDEKKQDKEKPQPEKDQISKEDAKRLLQALQNDEKNLQDKMKKQKVNGVKQKIEKDW